ncbi:hypothetical protein PGB90_004674 [Kerria lacca]
MKKVSKRDDWDKIVLEYKLLEIFYGFSDSELESNDDEDDPEGEVIEPQFISLKNSIHDDVENNGISDFEEPSLVSELLDQELANALNTFGKDNKVIAKKIRKKEKNRKNYTDPCVINLPVFSEPIAAQCSLDKDASLEFFQLYFTDDIMKLLKNWTSVKLNEICGFLALILHISLVVKPKLFDYWSKNLVLSTSFGLGIMPRDRFKSFLKHFLKVSQQMLLPGENLCIDEAICPFRGRISFKVYMKDKPEKYGSKIYAITDTVTGFILNADVYTDQLIVNKIKNVTRKDVC